MSLTPTQGFMTCDMIKRAKREKKRGPHEILQGSVASCQALLRMSAKAEAAPRGSAAAQSKEHLD